MSGRDHYKRKKTCACRTCISPCRLVDTCGPPCRRARAPTWNEKANMGTWEVEPKTGGWMVGCSRFCPDSAYLEISWWLSSLLLHLACATFHCLDFSVCGWVLAVNLLSASFAFADEVSSLARFGIRSLDPTRGRNSTAYHFPHSALTTTTICSSPSMLVWAEIG